MQPMQGMVFKHGGQIYDGGVLMGYYHDLTTNIMVKERFDALIVISHPEFKDYVFAVSYAPAGANVLLPNSNPSGFTRKFANAMGLSGDGYSARMWRGFHDSNKDGIYDSMGRLLFNKVVDPSLGKFVDYSAETANKLAWLITNFGVVSGRRSLERRLDRSIPEDRIYAYDCKGAKLSAKAPRATLTKTERGPGASKAVKRGRYHKVDKKV